MDDESELVMSPLCTTLEQNGRRVKVDMYRGDKGWVLEIVDEFNNSTVWEDEFDTDQAALDEAKDTIDQDGIEVLIGVPGGYGS